MKKTTIDWKKYGTHLLQGAKIYVTTCLVLVALVGTYGIYLWKNNPIAKPTQEMVSLVPNEVISKTDDIHQKASLLPPEATVVSDPVLTSEQPKSNVPVLIQQQPLQQPLQEQPSTVPVATADNTSATPEVQENPVQEVAQQPQPEVLQDKDEVQEKHGQAIDPQLMPALASPCSGEISRKFGISYDPDFQDYRYHDGIDYTIGDQGQIKAAQQGTIGDISQDLAGLFTMTIIHQGHITVYQYLDQVAVEVGQQVEQGQPIGTIKAGGKLHFGAEN